MWKELSISEKIVYGASGIVVAITCSGLFGRHVLPSLYTPETKECISARVNKIELPTGCEETLEAVDKITNLSASAILASFAIPPAMGAILYVSSRGEQNRRLARKEAEY